MNATRGRAPLPLTGSGLILTIKMSTIQHAAMPASTDLVQGTLDMLILKSVSLEPMHGFGIARRIEQVSDGVFKVNPGSLLVAFQRLEREGLLDAQWRATEHKRRARFYTLTRRGRRRLEQASRDWARRSAAIARLMEA